MLISERQQTNQIASNTKINECVYIINNIHNRGQSEQTFSLVLECKIHREFSHCHPDSSW